MSVMLLAGLLIAAAPTASATAVTPQAAPAPTMVFFDWGKMEIQRDYVPMLDAVAQAHGSAPGRPVIIEGHSDRSGSASSNLRSSRLRANVVRDYLVARGVPSADIVVTGVGEAAPFIPTPDGVREPQNRRVDVRFAGESAQ